MADTTKGQRVADTTKGQRVAALQDIAKTLTLILKELQGAHRKFETLVRHLVPPNPPRQPRPPDQKDG